MSDDNQGVTTERQDTGRAVDETTRKLLDAGTDYPELPGRHVTLNQVVAYNMAYFRKVAGLTQEELGERLRGWTAKPWSKAAVSAAERSWDGKRVRQFDADLIFGLSQALDVPITAFFLPPDSDGVEERYLIDPPYSYADAGGPGIEFICRNMYDLLTHALSDPTDDKDPLMDAYRGRLSSAIAMYYGSGNEVFSDDYYFEELTTEQQLTEMAARLRSQYESLRGVLGDIGITLERTYERMREAKKDQPEKLVRKSMTPKEMAEHTARFAQEKADIKKRHRAGESIESISKSTGTSTDHVTWILGLKDPNEEEA